MRSTNICSKAFLNSYIHSLGDFIKAVCSSHVSLKRCLRLPCGFRKAIKYYWCLGRYQKTSNLLERRNINILQILLIEMIYKKI
jgi:hypothetical protein